MRLFHGGKVREGGEFEMMKEEVLIFDRTPSFEDVVARIRTVLSMGLVKVL